MAPGRVTDAGQHHRRLPDALRSGRGRHGGGHALDHRPSPRAAGAGAGDGASPWRWNTPPKPRYAPLVALRQGRWKYTHCALDPEQLFDLEADPHELTNLAEDPAHAETLEQFRIMAAARWDLEAFDAEVRASQARRWVVYEALRKGGYYPWDYQPLQKASERYMRNHMDLNVVEENAALPARRMIPPSLGRTKSRRRQQ